uniref:Uncharacterized protein n=1 Tax=Nelumbo nucifera TaxID=4432 RepID=A0A822ZX16_NELNU|nr:TPA_asm: hypothetical protein HUJ06_017706 [Nelumbo nucifera]
MHCSGSEAGNSCRCGEIRTDDSHQSHSVRLARRGGMECTEKRYDEPETEDIHKPECQSIGTGSPKSSVLPQQRHGKGEPKGFAIIVTSCTLHNTSECKAQKLFWIVGPDKDKDEILNGSEELIDTVAELESPPEISQHAVSGTNSSQAMRIHGTLYNKPLLILIDSGSTQNFLDPRIAEKTRISPIFYQTFEVMVASGQKLQGSGKCNQVPIKTQGVVLRLRFFNNEGAHDAEDPRSTVVGFQRLTA